MRGPPRQELIERLTAHRGSYITREDFIYISERGLNMVRIPVPHFIFGDDPVYCEPYVPVLNIWIVHLTGPVKQACRY